MVNIVRPTREELSIIANGDQRIIVALERLFDQLNDNTENIPTTTDDLPEGTTNFYYTEARFDASFAGKDTDDLAEGSVNFYYTEARFDASLATKTSDDLTEGSTNRYYTSEREEEARIFSIMVG